MNQLLRSITILLVALLAADLPAQTLDNPGVQWVEDQIEATRASTSLDEAERETIIAIYEDALKESRTGDELRSRAAEFLHLAETAHGVLAIINDQLAMPLTEPELEAPGTLEEAAAGVQLAEAELESARRRVEEIRAEADARIARRPIATDELAEARTAFDTVDTQVRAAAVPENDTQAARLVLLRAQRGTMAARVDMLDAELRSYDARTELLPARGDDAARRVAEAQALVDAWLTAAAQADDADERGAASEILRLEQLAVDFPELTDLTERNSELVKERLRILDELGVVVTKLSEHREALDALRRDFNSSQRKVEAAGLNNAMGLLLRKEYGNLPDVGALRRRLRTVNRAMSDDQYQLVLLGEEREQYGAAELVAAKMAAELGSAGDEEATGRRNAELIALVESRRSLLNDVMTARNRYFDRLVDEDGVTQELIRDAEGYRQYIEERILWVRSVSENRLFDVRSALGAARWFGALAQWRLAGLSVADYLEEQWKPPLALTVAILILVLGRRTFKRELGRIRQRVERLSTDTVYETARAFIYGTLLALPLPATMFLVGCALRLGTNQVELGLAVGHGLVQASYALFPLEFLRQVLHQSGIGPKHFRWPDASVAAVRRELQRVMLVFVPAVFIWTTLNAQSEDAYADTLGRLSFVIGMIALSVFAYRVARRESVVYKELIRKQGGLIERAHSLWYPLAILLPAFLAGLSIAGYYYTATRLEERLRFTAWLVLGLLLINAFMMRWLMLARRRLLLEKRRQQREQEAAKVEGDAVPAAEEEAIDVPSIDAKTRYLFRSLVTIALVGGVLIIWSNVLPALRVLDRVQIWPSITILEDAETQAVTRVEPIDVGTAEPSEGAATPLVQTPITLMGGDETSSGTSTAIGISRVTLADLGLAVLVAVFTVIAVRNVPALLEMAVVGRLPLDSGSRYAILTVLKHALMLVGIVLAFRAVGIGWARVQWLAAALTFGLAFGLQEIFANFISGLIILAERPIRVGDTVTVQGVNGTVSRIRMRATTITDWDRKELVIPNKTFITEQVINWTLSNAILRATIHVGVSYSADIDRAEAELYQVAAANPDVLADPAPRVLFLGFGDSTLNFELRVFIGQFDQWFPVQHQLHRAIIRAFRAADVEIAFPQRDLHLRTSIPVPVEQPGS